MSTFLFNPFSLFIIKAKLWDIVMLFTVFIVLREQMIAISIFTFPNKLVIKHFQKTLINLSSVLHADEEALKQLECAS